MARATPDDQLKFLLSCVKHSNNGKIDFIEVAQECGVVSKGAAFVTLLKEMSLCADVTLRAKRYERLMKANGINPNGGPDPKPPPLNNILKAPRKNARDKVAKPPAKRRKVNTTAVKKQEEDSTTLLRPKQEPQPLESTKVQEKNALIPSAAPLPRVHHSHLVPPADEESSFDFNEFCSPEMFANCAPDTGHSRQEDASLITLAPQTASANASVVQDAPQAAKEDVMETASTWETVIIAD